MAMRLFVCIGLLFGLITASISEDMSMKKPRMSKPMGAEGPRQYKMHEMSGPMICYAKETMKGDILSQKLLNQATRLLGVSMMQGGDNGMTMKTLNMVTSMLQNFIKTKNGTGKPTMVKPTSEATKENTELGNELLDIIDNILGDDDELDIPGLTITRTEDEGMPMHDTPMGESNGMTPMEPTGDVGHGMVGGMGPDMGIGPDLLGAIGASGDIKTFLGSLPFPINKEVLESIDPSMFEPQFSPMLQLLKDNPDLLDTLSFEGSFGAKEVSEDGSSMGHGGEPVMTMAAVPLSRTEATTPAPPVTTGSAMVPDSGVDMGTVDMSNLGLPFDIDLASLDLSGLDLSSFSNGGVDMSVVMQILQNNPQLLASFGDLGNLDITSLLGGFMGGNGPSEPITMKPQTTTTTEPVTMTETPVPTTAASQAPPMTKPELPEFDMNSLGLPFDIDMASLDLSGIDFSSMSNSGGVDLGIVMQILENNPQLLASFGGLEGVDIPSLLAGFLGGDSGEPVTTKAPEPGTMGPGTPMPPVTKPQRPLATPKPTKYTGSGEMEGSKEFKAMKGSFESILRMVGVNGEIDQENLLPSVMKAMEFIMSADEETLDNLARAIGDLDIEGMFGMEGPGMEMKSNGKEMICYPADKETKSYLMMRQGQRENKMQKGCPSCKDMMMKMKKEMEKTVKSMVQSEVKRVMGTFTTAMRGMRSVDPEILTLLGGMISEGDKTGQEITAEGKQLILTETGQRGKWGRWTDWTKCDAECGGGIMKRKRTCLDNDPNDCEQMETKPCNIQKCEPVKPTADKWGPWSEWDACTRTCGGGVSVRSRMCTEEYETEDEGECEEAESRSCNRQPCDVIVVTEAPVIIDPDMKWQNWTDWDPCTKSCGGGVSVRSRMCHPEYITDNVDECEESESRQCNMEPCEETTTVARVWGQWGAWQACTAQCNGGTTYRTRQCLDGLPDCNEIESRMCNTQVCSRPIIQTQEWFDWTAWDPCSVSCGEGTTARTRECVRKATTSVCQQSQARLCNMGPCPVTTEEPRVTEMPKVTQMPSTSLWEDWGEWSGCSVTCGEGREFRRRVCIDPSLVENCEDFDIRPCSRPQCSAQKGVWGVWGDWTPCSASCGIGERTRIRPCLEGNCVGNNAQRAACSYLLCPETQVKKVCPPSPHKILNLADSCVILHSKRSDFNSARDYCTERGGDMVRMSNVDKWVQVTYWLKSLRIGSSPVRSWIGVWDVGHRGRWTHPSETQGSNAFVIWSQDQSSAGDVDMCGTLNPINGHAYSAPCTEMTYAICEYATS